MKLLDLTLPTPAENLACDEALLDAAEAGESGEVLRFWESSEHFVVVGYANKVATEVNTANCKKRGVPILRRCSGGGTVVQGPGCLSYALILEIADDGPTRSISAANQFIMERNRAAIASLNPQPSTLKVAVQGHTDLAVAGRKFSGNSQRRRKNHLLFHGAFLLDFNLALISKLLPLPSLQPDYRQARSHGDFLKNLDVSPSAIKSQLSHEWGATDPDSEFPTKRTAALVREKYATADWNSKF
jgi:lipoate-protein ligase A